MKPRFAAPLLAAAAALVSGASGACGGGTAAPLATPSTGAHPVEVIVVPASPLRGGSARGAAGPSEADQWVKNTVNGPPAATSDLVFAPGTPVTIVHLSNGLVVLSVADHRQPTLAMALYSATGYRDDAAGKPLSLLAACGIWDADSQLPGGATYEIAAAHIGFTWSTRIDGSVSGFVINGPAKKLDEALALVADHLHSFSAGYSDKTLRVERHSLQPVPRELAFDHALFPAKHPYRWPHEGDSSHATRTDVQTYISTYLTPANSVLAVVGDFDPASLRAKLDATVGQAPSGTTAVHKPLTPPPLPRATTLNVLEGAEPHVEMRWITPAWFAPGDAELDYADLLLRERMKAAGLGQITRATQVSDAVTSFFTIESYAQPGTGADVAAQIESVVDDLRREPPTDAEMVRARNVLFQRLTAKEPMEAVQVIAGYAVKRNPSMDAPQDVERYKAVTAEMVRAATAKYLAKAHAVTVFATPPSQSQSQSQSTRPSGPGRRP